jgi:hypothetical protein
MDVAWCSIGMHWHQFGWEAGTCHGVEARHDMSIHVVFKLLMVIFLGKRIQRTASLWLGMTKPFFHILLLAKQVVRLTGPLVRSTHGHKFHKCSQHHSWFKSQPKTLCICCICINNSWTFGSSLWQVLQLDAIWIAQCTILHIQTLHLGPVHFSGIAQEIIWRATGCSSAHQPSSPKLQRWQLLGRPVKQVKTMRPAARSHLDTKAAELTGFVLWPDTTRYCSQVFWGWNSQQFWYLLYHVAMFNMFNVFRSFLGCTSILLLQASGVSFRFI